MTRYLSYQEAKTDLLDYIRFCNQPRRHSTLGYLSPPMEFERQNASRFAQLRTVQAIRQRAACS
ncbi:IS3 family transposase [Ectopseudomonas mendocina]|uniref:IS3 family transposase n=1 Tax=Ectopseudomonas mendocina TaxID=300 RepID=UPI003F07EF65